MEIIQLTPDMHLLHVNATISNRNAEESIIWYDPKNQYYYIFQNMEDGSWPEEFDRQNIPGNKTKCWCLSNGEAHDLRDNFVTLTIIQAPHQDNYLIIN